MKKLIIAILLFASQAVVCNAQNELDSLVQECRTTTWHIYKPRTVNSYFELNTCTGMLNEVCIYNALSVKRGIKIINSEPLVPKEQQFKGRFTLCIGPGETSFILFDTEDGRAWEIATKGSFSSAYKLIPLELKK
jgi:hypothetical protein